MCLGLFKEFYRIRLILTLVAILGSRYMHYPHFKDRKTEAQRGQVTWSRSYLQSRVDSRFKLKQQDS